MTMEELLERLEMETEADIEYSECFCTLMETDAEVPEDLFFIMMRELEPDEMGVLMREYLSEIISGVADDCIDFYSMISSYKRSFGGLVNYYSENDEVDRIIAEIYSFREWYKAGGQVRVTYIDSGVDMTVSVCEALVLGRMERLSEGSYGFDYSSVERLDCGDFEDYVSDDEDEDYENYDYDRPGYDEFEDEEGYIQ